MENEKVLAVEQACREFGVAPSDLVCFIQALSRLPEEEAQKVIWMATGIALANGADVKESAM